MSGTILPGNLSDLERDLDVALSRIEQVEIPIAVLWDPWQCPAEVLPYLAWALSVDMWRTDWPERVKRRVVANSLAVHRIKGTRPAVELALRDLGVQADIIEWFEAVPKARRGTFDLIAWANENLTPGEMGFLNQALYDQIRLVVTNAKNTRSHFTFKVGVKFGPTPLGAASAITGMGALSRREAVATQPPLACVSSFGVALAGRSAAVSRVSVSARLDAQPRPVSVMVAGACRAWAVINLRMETKT
ncbi:phage tail protein I [Aeromonas sobria]|uniref:phage tail protein I n=1 Tax=Aeromonas sobria TaxID=646 RepID=UPI001116D380|nr:phage tail protein I [Aeromonas sobria]TNH81009.1 phage tail protein I [Aeromonas sobria]